MIEVTKSLRSGIEIKASGENTIDVFKQISSALDVFGDDECGCCGNSLIESVVRRVKLEKPAREFDSFELHCCMENCRAVKNLGVYADGSGLFARSYIEREDGTRDYSSRGWRKRQAKTDEQETQVAKSSDASSYSVQEQESTKRFSTMTTDLVNAEVLNVEEEHVGTDKQFAVTLKILNNNEEVTLLYRADAMPSLSFDTPVRVAIVRDAGGVRYIKRFFKGASQ